MNALELSLDLWWGLNWWIKYFFLSGIQSGKFVYDINSLIICTFFFLLSFYTIKHNKFPLHWARRRIVSVNSIWDKLMIVTILIRYKSWQSEIKFLYVFSLWFIQYYCFTSYISRRCLLFFVFTLMHINYGEIYLLSCTL
jgi:hypothetical protein